MLARVAGHLGQLSRVSRAFRGMCLNMAHT